MAYSVILPPMQPGLDLLTQADDAGLTYRMIDLLSVRIGHEWKKFARGTKRFTDTEIENIDVEETNSYEKCFRTIKTWEEKSIARVTIAMVKLNLVSMGRYDVIKDVFDDGGTAGTPVSLGGSMARPFSEPKISDLKVKHYHRLSAFLDGDHGIGVRNWLHLGNAIFQGDKDATELMERLQYSYVDGESPASILLTNIRIRFPSFTVGDFIALAAKNLRRDIVTFLESILVQPNQPFASLSYEHQNRVAHLLDKSMRGVKDWRAFAFELRFTDHEIEGFKTHTQDLRKYSQTEALLDLMKTRYPLLELTKLRKASSTIGRNDVAQYLDTVIMELRQ